MLPLSFRMRMPDGTCLTEWKEFYVAVKEFAFFYRDRRYSDVGDAQAHVSTVRNLMAICYGLALDGFRSFKNVNAQVIKTLSARLAMGNSGLFRAAERLERWLKFRDRGGRQGFKIGLPMRHLQAGGYANVLDNARLMALVGLPDSACRLNAVAYLCKEASEEAGFITRDLAHEEPPEEVAMSEQAIRRYLVSLEVLYLIRRRMTVPSLPEKPFANASALARELGSSTTPTPIPPAAQTLHLISHAIIWACDYGQHIVTLWEAATALTQSERATRANFENAIAKIVETSPQSGPDGSPWPLAERAVKVSGEQLSCQAAVRLLFAACFIIVAAFSARRKDEVLELTELDLRYTEGSGWELQPYIEKTLQRKDWIPVPPLVARAVELMVKLSASAREQTGNPSLFQWTNPFSTVVEVMINVADKIDTIDEFSRWVKTPLWNPPGGEPEEWHWTPHQFRKFFAVLYFYRFRGATIEVLAHFLRHFNLEMTRKYLTFDPGIKKIFDEVEWGFTNHVARNIATRGISTAGGMAKQLAKKWIDRMRKSVRVTSGAMEEAQDFIARQMKRNKLVLTPKAWVDCSCPRTKEATQSASCRQQQNSEVSGDGPDFSNAGPAVCVECPFSIDNGRLESAVVEERMNAQRIQVSELLAGSMVDELLQARVIKLHRFQERSHAS